jgi:ABC-type branched-subunit amino acid transport system substrate-binding protein
MRCRLLFLLFAIGVVATTAAAAQPTPWTVGVVVSRTGPATATGTLQAHAAERFADTLGRRGVFGTPIDVHVRDDAGDPARAATLALELVDAGAVAVVCCTTPQATARVATALESAGVPLLALTALDPSGGAWTFALAPSDRTRLTAIAVDAATEGKVSLALMTLSTAFGDAALGAFERALSDTGRSAAGEARYPADAPVLTPEALWIATRQPGAVVVWGLPTDLPRALDALRRRGYDGLVYARPEAIPTAQLERVRLDDVPIRGADPWTGLRTPLPPAALGELLPVTHPNHDAATDFFARTLGGDPRRSTAFERGVLATVDDALVWLLAAQEQVAALGLDDGVATRRQALRDALIGLPPMALAAGVYDASDGDRQAARWQGLVVAGLAPPAP